MKKQTNPSQKTSKAKPQYRYYEINIQQTKDGSYFATIPEASWVLPYGSNFIASGETFEGCIARTKESIGVMYSFLTPEDKNRVRTDNYSVSKIYLPVEANDDEDERMRKALIKIFRSKRVQQYLSKKHLLKLSDRYIAIFEYKNGITDGTIHTNVATGKKFGISGGRAGAILARVTYEIEKL